MNNDRHATTVFPFPSEYLAFGVPRDEANARLRRNHGIVASFSRALVEGLSTQQSEAEFNAVLDGSIQSIFAASNT